MKAQLIVADAASYHPDGVVSALRMGITKLWRTPGAENASSTFAIIPSLHLEPSEAGKHKVSVSVRDSDGRIVWPAGGVPITAEVTSHEGGTAFLPPLGVSMQVPLGRYEVSLVLDGEQRATWPLSVQLKTGDAKDVRKAQ